MSHSARSASSTAGTVTLGRLLVFGGGAWLFGLALSAWIADSGDHLIPATLQAKTLSVSAARPAILAELFVKPGQTVAPDTPLFRLADDRLTGRIAAKRREQTELSAELARVEAAADVDLEWRRRELQNDVFQTELRAAELLQARVHHQVEQLAWEEQLAGLDWWIGVGAHTDVQPIALEVDAPNLARLQALLRSDQAASSLEANAAQLALCQRKLAELAELEAKLTEKVRISAGVDVAQTRLQRAAAELHTLEDQERALTIHSPGYGTVGSVSAQVADPISGGQCVIELLDGEQRFVIAQVPSATVSQFQVGETVTVRFAPRMRLQGTIVEIPPLAESTDADQDATIPIRIAPKGKLWPQLPIGSRVDIEAPRAQ